MPADQTGMMVAAVGANCSEVSKREGVQPGWCDFLTAFPMALLGVSVAGEDAQ